MKKTTRSMLKALTEVNGVPGFEEDVRGVIREYLPKSVEVTHDRLGSLICAKTGTADSPRIMIPGHMDEIGFMVKLITKEGFIRFAPLGGWPDQVLLSQRVIIRGRKGDVPGLIGAKPPHLMSGDERGKMVKKDDMFIDVGAKDEKEVTDKLGIRVGDLKALTLHNLNWNTKTIEINQSKTGRHISYPILDDIGWALIDYLKNSRPETYSQFVFVRLIPPYEEFGENANLHNIISKYTRLAGIKIPKGVKHGMHSLRHALASTLLEQKTPLPVISAILGHLNSKSTNVYLQTGIEGLRQCAIDPEEVFNHEK